MKQTNIPQQVSLLSLKILTLQNSRKANIFIFQFGGKIDEICTIIMGIYL